MHLMFPHRDLSYEIIAAAIEVHKNLGPGLLEPGLLESVYRLCMEAEEKSINAELKHEEQRQEV